MSSSAHDFPSPPPPPPHARGAAGGRARTANTPPPDHTPHHAPTPPPMRKRSPYDSLSAPGFNPDEIETGRKLFAAEWRFVAAAGSVSALPAAEGVEVAFAGGSNVGQSRPLHAFAGRPPP